MEPESAFSEGPGYEGLYVHEEGCILPVWQATLTVGEASDSINTYRGYVPSLSPPVGDLGDTVFAYGGVEYTVENLFYQQFADSVRQLVLNTGTRLPARLALTVGMDQFLVSHSTLLGPNQNIHVWRLDSDICWEEGQEMVVSLTETQLRLPESQDSKLAVW